MKVIIVVSEKLFILFISCGSLKNQVFLTNKELKKVKTSNFKCILLNRQIFYL